METGLIRMVRGGTLVSCWRDRMPGVPGGNDGRRHSAGKLVRQAARARDELLVGQLDLPLSVTTFQLGFKFFEEQVLFRVAAAVGDQG